MVGVFENFDLNFGAKFQSFFLNFQRLFLFFFSFLNYIMIIFLLLKTPRDNNRIKSIFFHNRADWSFFVQCLFIKWCQWWFDDGNNQIKLPKKFSSKQCLFELKIQIEFFFLENWVNCCKYRDCFFEGKFFLSFKFRKTMIHGIFFVVHQVIEFIIFCCILFSW